MSLYRDAAERRVLAVLAAAARAGAPCPNNLVLGEEAGCSTEQVALLMDGLVRRGVVAVERDGRWKRRVTIAGASGPLRTGWTRQVAADPLRIADAGPKLTAAEIAARRIDRAPCPRCGVRADIGCRHAAASGRGLAA